MAHWVKSVGRQRGDINTELIDLAEVNLPLLDEEQHPRLGQYRNDHTCRWSAQIDAADAFVLVTPEYNHSFPASLKNAMDYLSREWADKPAGIVSYGGMSAGLRAAAALRPVMASLRLASLGIDVAVPFVEQTVHEDGSFHPDPRAVHAAEAMFERLVELGHQLREVRRGA